MIVHDNAGRVPAFPGSESFHWALIAADIHLQFHPI